jgi:hypothetical protein
MEFVRRIGPDPHIESDGGDERPTIVFTPAAKGCPDLWELDTGDVAVIGLDHTAILSSNLPGTSSCGPDEQIVVVPRRIFDAAARDWTRGTGS